MTDLGFTPVGEGWNRPKWKQALIWIRWRPWCWLKGEYWHFRIKTADRLYKRFGRDFPFFRIQTWVGRGETEDHPDARWQQQLNRSIVAVHYEPPCGCGSQIDYYPHHLLWLPAPEYRWVGDDFWKKEDKMYKLNRPKNAD